MLQRLRIDPGKLRAKVRALGTWRARGLAFVLGFAAVAAMPPTYQIYILIPAFSGLLWLAADAPTKWRAFTVGWFFGAGFFTAGLYWVSFALLVDAAKFAWLIPFAVLGFAFGMGLFAAFAALAVRAAPGPLWARALVLAGVWALLEWLRAWLLTGFPWNPVGSVWAVSDVTIQGAAWVGVFGQSLLTVLIAAAPGALAEPARAPKVLTGVAVLGIALMTMGGAHRLSQDSGAVHDGVRLRLIQPNIPQAEKWRPELRARNMEIQLALMTAPPRHGAPAPTHVIWAETSAPFFIENHKVWRRVVADATPREGLTILGAPRVVQSGGSAGGGEDGRRALQVANSLLAFDGEGALAGVFDKFHLVPFGEYVPLSEWLPLDKITQGVGAFTAGPGPITLELKGLPPVSPLICYEIIFPHEVTDGSGRAQWLLNLTNDAWYGNTAGPYQHFVSARLRAVEQGLPTVRVAYTGISAIIDAYGQLQGRIGLSEQGFLDGPLPKAIQRPGLYARFGNPVPVSCAMVVLLLGFAMGLRAQNPL